MSVSSILSEGTDFPSGTSDKALAVASLVVLGVLSAALTIVGMFWRVVTGPKPVVPTGKVFSHPAAATKDDEPPCRLPIPRLRREVEYSTSESKAPPTYSRENPPNELKPPSANELKPPSANELECYERRISAPNTATGSTSQHGEIIMVTAHSTSV